MLISIVIPTYNYGHFIHECLDSLTPQLAEDCEIIVVDDGSTDDTSRIMQSYVERYPQCHYFQQANAGPARARNHGVQQSKGTYVLFLDADDYLVPNALHLWREAIKHYPDKDALFGRYQTLTSSKKIKYSKRFHLSPSKERNFLAFLQKKISLAQGANLIKHSVFSFLNYPEQIRGREDLVFDAQLIANFDVMVLDEVVACIRRHADSLRHAWETHISDELLLVDILFDPQKLPKNLLKYKKLYTANICLSNFRLLFKAKKFSEAWAWYHKALQNHLRRALTFSYLRKAIRCYFYKRIISS